MFGNTDNDWMKRASAAANRAPRRQQQSHRLRWGLLGLASGAAAMFMFDPRTGNRRRALLRDQFVHFSNVVGDFVNGTVPQKLDYASGFVRGMQHDAMEAAGGGQSHWNDDSQTITDRVMSEVFRDPDLPKGEVNVNTVDHVVYLRGHVDNPALVQEIEVRTRQVPGVRNVVNLINQPQVDPSTVRPGFDNRTESPRS